VSGVSACVAELVVREDDASAMYPSKCEGNTEAGRTTTYVDGASQLGCGDFYVQSKLCAWVERSRPPWPKACFSD